MILEEIKRCVKELSLKENTKIRKINSYSYNNYFVSFQVELPNRLCYEFNIANIYDEDFFAYSIGYIRKNEQELYDEGFLEEVNGKNVHYQRPLGIADLYYPRCRYCDYTKEETDNPAAYDSIAAIC